MRLLPEARGGRLRKHGRQGSIIWPSPEVRQAIVRAERRETEAADRRRWRRDRVFVGLLVLVTIAFACRLAAWAAIGFAVVSR
jgi:hypothetical protein